MTITNSNERKLNRIIIAKGSLIATLILLGAKFPFFKIIALLLAVSCILLSRKRIEILGILVFVLPFSPIFKMHPTGNTLFNVLNLVTILKLLYTPDLRLSYKEILSIIAFISYVLAIGGVNSVVRLINLCIHFALIILLFKTDEKIDFKSILYIYTTGIILAATAALLSEYIPELSSFMNLVKIKLENAEYMHRFSGLQGNPNFFTMDVSIILAGWFSLIASNKRLRLIDYLSVIILIVFGIMSLSKSFFVAFIIILLVLALNVTKQNIAISSKNIFIICIVFITVYFLIDKTYFNVFLGRILKDVKVNSSLSSITTGRYEIWLNYTNYIFSSIKNMIFGEGLGAKYFEGSAPHNYFIEIIYYLGVLGATLYFLCIKNIFPKIDRTFKRNYINYLPLIILLVRGMGVDLIFRETMVFYFIIIVISINTDFNLKRKYNSLNSEKDIEVT